MADADEVLQNYTDSMLEGDFVVEQEEGRNKRKYLTPQQIKELTDLSDSAAEKKANKSIPLISRIR